MNRSIALILAVSMGVVALVGLTLILGPSDALASGTVERSCQHDCAQTQRCCIDAGTEVRTCVAAMRTCLASCR